MWGCHRSWMGLWLNVNEHMSNMGCLFGKLPAKSCVCY